MKHKSISVEEHSKALEVLYYLISKSHSSCGSFYSPMLRYCGIRHHECVLPKDCLHLKTSVSLCTRFICVCGWNHVRLWTWTRPGNMIFQLKARVLVKMCICVHVSVVHLKPVLEISSADLWITPLVDCPIYFRSLWNYISYWYWTPFKDRHHTWKTWRLILLLAGSQAISLDATWTAHTLYTLVPADCLNLSDTVLK